MCWRVKYRKKGADGEMVRIKVRVESTGVHKKNRGSVYPAGVRCKSLSVDVLEAGFVKEEVNHAVVVVEETPPDQLRSRGPDYVSGSTYNGECSRKDELLITCFQEPYADVRFMALAHNHMILILRAFITGAKWDLPGNAAKNIRFCDEEGKLSLAAVAESPNGRELAELVKEGLDGELLSWRMDMEEPDAASVISHALNKGHELALRTTELTAVAVLKGEIIAQMSQEVGQRVAFKTVRDRVRSQLDAAADDPDLPELFDFLIALGVGKNSYADDLLEFGGCFVDSKKRQLRFGAFAVVNRICPQAPWTKVAVVKRSYRKKPLCGFCPSPEAAWGQFEWNHLQLLEELLRFFHATCVPLLDKLLPQSRNKLLANVDVSATDAFWLAKDAKQKNGVEKIQSLLLEATHKYWETLDKQSEGKGQPTHPWILYKKKEEAAVLEKDVKPAVIHFDEHSGAQLNVQVEFPKEAKEKKEAIRVPWRLWRLQCNELGSEEADMAAAVAVLHTLHEKIDTETQSIEVWLLDGRAMVTASGKVPAQSMLLPPCVPKSSKVHLITEHPYAISLVLKVMRSTEDSVQNGQGNIERQRNLFVLPEFKMPELKPPKPAVAEEAPSQPEWIWRDDVTLHPFWAVRRLTEQQLAKHNANKGQKKARFNCVLQTQALSDTIIAAVGRKALNRTRIMELPFITNSVDLVDGEELFLEVFEATKKGNNAKRTWRDAVKEKVKDDAKQQQKKGKKT